MSKTFVNGRITLHNGDCLDVLATLAENSIDSCVTDPPYHLTNIVKRVGKSNLERDESNSPLPSHRGGSGNQYKRVASGFMGKQWDGGAIAQSVDLWRQVYRVLKPGAHLLAFGGTRTYHRMACAIEDAGFEIRDCIQWLYGSGFPKSHDVSKGIDKAAGEQRERIRGIRSGVVQGVYAQDAWSKEFKDSVLSSDPITDAARQWEGWGTALKPACEPIVLARKPLSERTVAANVLRWGTGAINVDGCRVGMGKDVPASPSRNGQWFSGNSETGNEGGHNPNIGRWPANLIHDGSDEVLAGFPESQSGELKPEHQAKGGFAHPNCYHAGSVKGGSGYWGANEGSAARFFYTTKADSDDRIGSKHPTVKPLDLMQYLVRLVTPKGGTVLDMFAGSGTTGEAAFREGMKAVLIEREAEYQADIRRRMALCLAGPDERTRESVKARFGDKLIDLGPLFRGIA